jgi:putative IMPACT (imprinted ancient) family translation regulator
MLSNENSSSDIFLQIKEPRRAELKVKGSRFIASAGRVTNDEEIKQFLDTIAKQFHDATHHCYAWRIGFGKSMKYRYADNGEPSSTAGLPIFRAIEACNLSNVIVVVTRYFAPMAKRPPMF